MLSRRQPEAFQVDIADLRWRGRDLVRPECVLATKKGDLFTADWRGGVAHLLPSGEARLYKGDFDHHSTAPRAVRPNGIALRRDGSFLFADLGETEGGVFSLSRDGKVEPVLQSVDGIDLPPSNFVTEDKSGRLWLTVSTRHVPRALAYTRNVADGFVVLIDEKGARIVADGLGYTNETLVSPDGHWLYVVETYKKLMSRFRINTDNSLGPREIFTEFGAGQFPDGIAFDDAGGIWVACVIGNQVLRVAPDGSHSVILADTDQEYVDWVEAAFAESKLGRAHMDRPHTTTLQNISSVAFGGTDLKTIYIGCLLGGSIASFRIPEHVDLRGLPPVHWEY